MRHQNISHGRLAGRDYNPSLKNSWGIHQRFLKECRINRPDANDREHCKGERQCGEDTDRRKERRESCYCQGTRETWATGGRLEDGSLQRTRGQVNRELHCVFHLILKMSIEESDVRKVLLKATSWRLRECVRVRELAAPHRLGQMRRLRMLEEQKAWKREAGFDRIDTAAEMDAQRFRTNLVSEHFYSKLFNPRWPHTPNECTLEMRVDAERLRMEIVLSQPAPPPQCDPSPRRLPAVDTGSEEPRTPRRSPAIGTGSDEPRVSRAETQSTEREESVPLQASADGFLRFNCTSPERECILSQPDVGVDDNDEATTSKVQAGTRKEFGGLPIGRQQRETSG